jgi:type I site-specific restriction endonuclease
MSVSLRPYQVEAVDRLRASMRRHRRVCFQLPTGGGKTIIFGYIAQGVCARGRCVLILVHRRELIRQTLEKLAFFGIEARVIAAGWPADSDQAIQVASVQTLARRLEQAPDADLVIVDECCRSLPRPCQRATGNHVLRHGRARRARGRTFSRCRLPRRHRRWFDATARARFDHQRPRIRRAADRD